MRYRKNAGKSIYRIRQAAGNADTWGNEGKQQRVPFMDRMSPSRSSPDGLPPLLMLDDKGKQHAHRPHILTLITA